MAAGDGLAAVGGGRHGALVLTNWFGLVVAAREGERVHLGGGEAPNGGF